jgi:hypothetical protein
MLPISELKDQWHTRLEETIAVELSTPYRPPQFSESALPHQGRLGPLGDKPIKV